MLSCWFECSAGYCAVKWRLANSLPTAAISHLSGKLLPCGGLAFLGCIAGIVIAMTRSSSRHNVLHGGTGASWASDNSNCSNLIETYSVVGGHGFLQKIPHRWAFCFIALGCTMFFNDGKLANLFIDHGHQHGSIHLCATAPRICVGNLNSVDGWQCLSASSIPCWTPWTNGSIAGAVVCRATNWNCHHTRVLVSDCCDSRAAAARLASLPLRQRQCQSRYGWAQLTAVGNRYCLPLQQMELMATACCSLQCCVLSPAV